MFWSIEDFVDDFVDSLGFFVKSLLLGVIANRFPGQTLYWNADTLTVTNVAEANELVRRTYRKGYEVAGL